MDAREPATEKPLWLTREEAFGLLELSIASMARLGEAEEAVLHKVGQICRAFVRDEAASANGARKRAIRGRRPRSASSAIVPRSRVRRSLPRTFMAARAW
jgi:hypothetical protein